GIQLLAGEGKLVQHADRRWRIEIQNVVAKVLYRQIELLLGFEEVKPGIWVPGFETFLGTFTADVIEEDDGISPNRLIPSNGSLVLRYDEGGLGWIKDLKIPAADLALKASAAQPVPPSCPNGMAAITKTLSVRPIGLKNQANDQTP